MESKPILEVCLSPALLHLFDTNNTIVVIIDIFRATSTITTVLHQGAKAVIPIASVEECIAMKNVYPNCITAGERDGKIAPGLDYGNSPLTFTSEFIKGKTLALTTTNGTKLLHMIQQYDQIIVGSFLNVDAICNYLIKQNKKVLLACAAWKDRVNKEDSLFAGAVVEKVKNHFAINCDSARITNSMYNNAMQMPSLLDYLKNSSHYNRLSGYGLYEDLTYCTTPNLHPIVPIYKDKQLVIV